MEKKVIFVTNSLSGGGAERVMSIISNHLCNNNYTVKIILLQKKDIAYDFNDKVELICRENIKPRDILGQIKFIRNVMKKNKGALFVSFFTHQNLYTILASIGVRVKVLVSERNDPYTSFPKKIGFIIRNALYKSHFCNEIVCQTKGAAKYYKDAINRDCPIIPNPLKEDLPEAFIGERKKNVVAVGRLNAQKNYRLLVDAFREFSKTHPDYTLEIYGDGYLKDKIQGYLERNNLDDRIHLCGFCKDVHSRIIDAGMYVMSSDFEGLSNAMLEALALGLPVISTDHPPGGAREYIRNFENGILTPVKDVEEMTKAMCFMADNPEKAKEMGINALKLRQELSTNTICQKWKDVFDGLL